MICDYLKLARVHQWIKNLFVFAGVFLAGKILTPIFFDAFLVFVSFCFASSVVYIINDLKDIQRDRLHPEKKNRPLPSRRIAVKNAVVLLALLLLALLTSFAAITRAALFVIIIYIMMNIFYTYFLRDTPIIDLLVIASGFILRVLAGTYGIGIETSSWLLATIIFLSLFLALGKRLNEKGVIEDFAHRPLLERYSQKSLTYMILITATLSIIFYSLYIVNRKTEILPLSTILVVVYGFFRYLYLIHLKRGVGDPTEELLKDKPLLAAVLLGCILLFWGLYL